MNAPAPDELQMIERAIELAAIAVCEQCGLPHVLVPGAKAGDDPTFIEILASLGVGLNLGDTPAGLEYDHYAFTLTYRLVTPRPPQTYVMSPEVRSLHEKTLGRVRDAFRLTRGLLNAGLPYHRIIKLEPAGCQRTFNEDLWADEARQIYSGELTIPAWAFASPVGPA